MAQSGQRKCLSCSNYFYPDRRNRERQRFCSATECQRASKTVSQAKWTAKPANSGYFRDPAHVARVQAWRIAHPGYCRGKPRRPTALQETFIAQAPEPIEESQLRTEIAVTPDVPALQDLWEAPSPVLTGLIAHLFEVTLQDDIAATILRLVKLGHDVINGRHHENSQTRATAGAAPPSARAVQLG
jgi:hypothetical protein